MDVIVKIAKFTAGLFNYNMTVWFITLGIIFVAVSVYKAYLIESEYNYDSQTVSDLAEFQRKAADWSADKKIHGLAEVFDRHRNRISWMYYKYFITHKNFAEIKEALTADEYRKVTGRMKISAVSWVLIIAAVWIGFMNLCNQFSYNYIAVWNGLLDKVGLGALLILFMFLGGCALHLVSLIIYRESVFLHKRLLFEDLAVTAPPFFASLDYKDAAVFFDKGLCISREAQRRIKRQIIPVDISEIAEGIKGIENRVKNAENLLEEIKNRPQTVESIASRTHKKDKANSHTTESITNILPRMRQQNVQGVPNAGNSATLQTENVLNIIQNSPPDNDGDPFNIELAAPVNAEENTVYAELHEEVLKTINRVKKELKQSDTVPPKKVKESKQKAEKPKKARGFTSAAGGVMRGIQDQNAKNSSKPA